MIAQHPGPAYNPPPNNNRPYFYLHDRLGSVRQIIYSDGNVVNVVNCYTYDPWGLPVGDQTQTQETVSNMYGFANYAWDSEILQYHCFRRQYDPVLARFTSRDPVAGGYEEPMTLHKYLYCINNPVNKTDPTGQLSVSQLGNLVVNTIYGASSYYTRLDASLKGASDWGSVLNAAIGVNQWRQGWFDRQNLENNSNIRDMLQARAEGFALRTLDALIEAEYQAMMAVANLCDWGGLGLCLAAEYMTLEVSYPGLAASCKGACSACIAAPPNPACVPCIGCMGVYGAGAFTCVATNCGGQ